MSLPGVVAWAERHWVLQGLLAACYHTIVPQTLLVIAILGWLGGWRHVELLMTRLLVAVMLTLVLYAAFPAAGPLAGEHAMSAANQARFPTYFLACYDGQPEPVHLFFVEGLITFPSFHAAWAMVLAAAFVAWPRLLAVFAPLNAGVVVSALTIGWHYGIDLIVGLILAAVAIAASGRQASD